MEDRPDLYVILGVPPDATPEELRVAYRERAAVLHPDRFDPDRNPAAWSAANQMLRDLNAAYHILSTPDLRRQYDGRHAASLRSQSEGQVRSDRSPQPRAGSRAGVAIGGLLLALLRFWPLALFGGVLIWIYAEDAASTRQADEVFRTLPSRLQNLDEVTSPNVAALPPPPSQPVGCGPGIEASSLPQNGRVWRYSDREAVAPLEILVSGDGQYLVKVEEAGRAVAAMFVRAGSTAEMSVPLGTYALKYATGSGEFWCGHDARFPFGRATTFARADEPFRFTDEGTHYSGYTVELFLREDGNLRTTSLSPDAW